MGYEALTGRLPDQVALHFLDSGLVGKVDVDPKRLAKARERMATAAAGIRAWVTAVGPARIEKSREVMLAKFGLAAMPLNRSLLANVSIAAA